MPTRQRRRIALLLVATLIAAVAVVVLLAAGDDDDGPRRLAPGRGSTDTARDPFAYDADRREELEGRAADGLAHPLYAKSPGGALATARRVAAFRPLVDEVAARADEDADTLEAIVFLESAGRPSAQASDDLGSAAGLTQILAQTGTALLGLKVDVAASSRLTRSIGRATSERRIRALAAQRRRVDERFDPRKALEATTRYLAFARGQLDDRDDLAVVSYHMGVGNLQRALGAYGRDDIPYAQLFFDSTPLRHPEAWAILASLGDDSSTYLWRIGAARKIMALFREDPAKLARQALLQAGPSGEGVLRPPDATPRFADDAALRTGDLALIDGPGLRVSRALAGGPEGHRALRADALVLLRDLAAGVQEVSGAAPLVVTAAARSVKGEARGVAAETAPSAHTTGYAFDLSRDYRTPAQAQALQFWLDRLTALDLIAWTREPDVIHVTVGPRAEELR